MPKIKETILCIHTEPKGRHDMMREIASYISRQRLKSIVEYMGKINYGNIIPVDADAGNNYPEVLSSTKMNNRWLSIDPAKIDDEECFISNCAVIEERLSLWLAEG
jgi:hypothetical protein